MIFTKNDANVLIGKLGAKFVRGNKHDLYGIMHEGKRVARISVRRSSHEVGHGFLPEGLNITRPQTKEIIACRIDRAEYLNILKANGALGDKES